jgi:membrane-associated phospholipid phosphatase
MLELFTYYDHLAFHYCNGIWRNDWADYFMPLMRKASNWIPLYLGLLIYLFWTHSKSFWQTLIFILLTVGFADAISSHLIKKSVKRPRPCRETTIATSVVNIVPCGGGYSFTSSHAANHYALATAFSLTLFRRNRRIQLLFFSWAACIAYAQVYVGVHYPLDIGCGAILGIIIALITYKCFTYFKILI